MPINVNKVYQAVLDIANKEQRGYITPKEFNVFANHAQDEIFTSYFAKSNIHGQSAPNDSEHSDPHDISQEKIEYFEREVKGSAIELPQHGAMITPTDFYKMQTVLVGTEMVGQVNIRGKLFDNTFSMVEAEYVSKKELITLMGCKINRPTVRRPVYTFEGTKNNFIRVFGQNNFPNNFTVTQSQGYQLLGDQYSTLNNFDSNLQPDGTSMVIQPDRLIITYIRKPKPVVWGYNKISLGAADVLAEHPLYDNTKSVDFEIHSSEYNNLVAKILLLSGLKLNQPALAQYGKATSTEQNQIMK